MRNEFDILKSFAILLVVLGHVTTMYRQSSFFDGIPVNTTLAAITFVIYIFHMPLFIALSGAVYEYGIGRGKYGDFKLFIVNKVKRIIVPCVFVGVCVLSPTLYLIKDTSITSCLYDIYVLGGVNSRHLWYLGAIFWCYLWGWFITKSKVNLLLMFLISVFLEMIFVKIFVFNYLYIKHGVCALKSFVFGMALVRYKVKNNTIALLGGMSCLMLLILGINIIESTKNAKICELLLPYSIVFMLFIVARLLKNSLIDNYFLAFILRNVFPIYLFHVECIYLMYNYWGKSVPAIIMIPFAVFSSISVSVFLAYLIRKLKLQCLIGEK